MTASASPASSWPVVVQLQVTLFYQEPYLPSPRHRKPRTRPATSEGVYTVPFARRQDAPVVMAIRDRATCRLYRMFNSALYVEAKREVGRGVERTMTVENLQNLAQGHATRRYNPLNSVVQGVQTALEGFVVVDGLVYQRATEPVFEVFQGDIELLPDLPATAYQRRGVYNLLERAEAIRQARRENPKFDEREVPTVQVFAAEQIRQVCHAQQLEVYEIEAAERSLNEVQQVLRKRSRAVQRMVLTRALERLHVA